MAGMRRALDEGVKALRDTYEAMERQAADLVCGEGKFSETVFSMACGTIADFHGGLSQRVGEFSQVLCYESHCATLVTMG